MFCFPVPHVSLPFMVLLVVAVVLNEREYDVQQLVFHVVEGDTPWFPRRDESVVIGLQGWVVKDCYQGGLGELALEFAVAVAPHVGTRVDGRT